MESSSNVQAKLLSFAAVCLLVVAVPLIKINKKVRIRIKKNIKVKTKNMSK